MGEVVWPSLVTKLDLPAERVLQAALDEGLSKVVILGYDKDGEEYIASSIASSAEINWLLELCRKWLLSEEEN